MSTALDQARLILGARARAAADHPCRRWGRIVHLYPKAPVARIVCDCGWQGDVPLRRLSPEPVEVAELPPDPKPSRRGDGRFGVYWTCERIVEALTEWAIVHGGPPSMTEWHRAGESHPPATTVQQRFGSWRAGLAAAGMVPRPSRPRRHGPGEVEGDPTRTVKRPDS